MFQLTYLWLGTFATLLTIGAMRSGNDWLTRFLSALLGMVAWAVWALASFEVQVVDGGDTVTHEYMAMAALGAVGALLLLLMTWKSGIKALGGEDEGGASPTANMAEVRR